MHMMRDQTGSWAWRHMVLTHTEHRFMRAIAAILGGYNTGFFPPTFVALEGGARGASLPE